MPLSFKLMGIGFLLFVVGFFMSTTELRLMIWGKRTEARIDNAWLSHGLSRSTSTKVAVEYIFSDDSGKDSKGVFYVSEGWHPPPDLKLNIIFLPYDPSVNRLAGETKWSAFIIFFAGIGLMVFGFWYFSKRETVIEAHRETAATLERAHARSLTGRVERFLDK